ncbi:MAG: BadF/BadG/BcrA/BcrD ATPase family protein [Lachnospiraceae bacterium]|nr:BadF/BadG/BcrA/BcrD ATPase family protein [Lachnospiraceae bacterium]
MYVLGIDAGGTKTHCAVADETGKIMGEGFSGPANHQTCGRERAKQSLQDAVNQALEAAGLEKKDIAYGVFGMSGADGEDDFILLNGVVGEIMEDVDFEVMHDGWIGFRSAVDGNMGIVSICGTGAGHAGENRQGERLTLRNLDYITGNVGGGGDLARKAMHYAFRSNEGTAEKTELEKELPGLFHVETMDQVCAIVKNREIPEEQQYQLPRLVFRLAGEGDAVCRKLITWMGYEEGRYAAAIIRRLHMEEEEVPVVLIGSLFGTRNSLLIDAYMKAVHAAAEKAYPIIPEAAPVTGAVKIAVEHLSNQKTF